MGSKAWRSIVAYQLLPTLAQKLPCRIRIHLFRQGCSSIAMLSILSLLQMANHTSAMEIRCGTRNSPASIFNNIIVGSIRKITFFKAVENDMGGVLIYAVYKTAVDSVERNNDKLVGLEPGNEINILHYYVCTQCKIVNGVAKTIDGRKISDALLSKDQKIFVLFPNSQADLDLKEIGSGAKKIRLTRMNVSPCIPPKALDEIGKAWLAGT